MFLLNLAAIMGSYIACYLEHILSFLLDTYTAIIKREILGKLVYSVIGD